MNPPRLIASPIFLEAPDDLRIAASLLSLHDLAEHFWQPLSALQATMTLRVFFVVGSSSPWKLIEVLRSRYGRTRRVLCFDNEAQLRTAIEERLAWQRADEEFVERNMSTAGGTVTADWVPSKDFEMIFGAKREEIRRSICDTSPTRAAIFGVVRG